MPKKKTKLSRKPKRRIKLLPGPPAPVHPWRTCLYGEHWVSTHPLHVPPSKEHPSGSVTTRHEHCAKNPSGKDQLYPEEIVEIARKHFSNLVNKPCPLALGYANGSDYDGPIAGWVQYWNEVLQPTELLEPNFIKALIATESGFNPATLANKKNKNSARGLMQVTNDTRKILGDEEGEIKDRYVNASREELNDPNVNICAGVRWLFHKRELLSKKLDRQATWLETVHKYKGTGKVGKNRAKVIVKKFETKFEELQKCGK